MLFKTTLEIDEIRLRLEDGAKEQYGVREIVRRYMAAIEEIFNIPKVVGIFNILADQGRVFEVLDEIIRWSKKATLLLLKVSLTKTRIPTIERLRLLGNRGGFSGRLLE